MCRACFSKIFSWLFIIILIVVFGYLFWKNPPWFAEIINSFKNYLK